MSNNERVNVERRAAVDGTTIMNKIDRGQPVALKRKSMTIMGMTTTR